MAGTVLSYADKCNPRCAWRGASVEEERASDNVGYCRNARCLVSRSSGALLWASMMIRPDIAALVRTVAKLCENSGMPFCRLFSIHVEE